MKLQILVPQYKETDEVIKPLLDSIALQQTVDLNEVGIIIVNDGSDVFLTDKFLKSYPFRIKYVKAGHGGVSAARQKALDLATAEYVMFCDADDMFYSMCGLWVIFREIDTNGGFDSLYTTFIEEVELPDGSHNFVNRENDSTFVHGKVHRRKYLKKQNIRWNPELTVHEDSYFNVLCQKCSKNVKYCPTSFYLWRWRDDSVCRSDFKYILKTYNNLLDSNTALINELLRRNMRQDAQLYVTTMIYDAYFTMNKDEWINQENKEYRDSTEKRFALYYRTFKRLFDEVPMASKGVVLQSLRNRFYREGMFLETITFESWIAHINELAD